MKHKQTNDVTRPSHPRYEGASQQPRGAVSPGTIEPNATVQKSLPPIEPMAAASGFAATNLPTGSDPVYRDSAPENLPQALTANEERAVSRSPRYGNSAIGYEAHPAIEPRDKGIAGTTGLPSRDITGRAWADAAVNIIEKGH